ncbi:unnamed protein product [Prorocentrum cordatum]|uniref:C3H1-type domain-containing protein n=1 Tax=Prorocentrum cordatum TaxID=2364126 RepID=A0ABN9R8V1_9DINO|nr:unnamed protein product [Polarella glacialis]
MASAPAPACGDDPRGPSEWPYETDAGDHFETSVEAYRDIAPLLRVAARSRARARGRPLAGAEERLRVYDPYFCSGRAVELLRGLGYPQVINRRRDFYRDIAEGAVPKYDVLVTNPPYSEEPHAIPYIPHAQGKPLEAQIRSAHDHKERLFDFVLGRQRRARDRGVPEPFMLLLPSWTMSKAVCRRFLRDLAKLPEAGEPRVFFACPRGDGGRPARYSFDHVHGAGRPVCPFFAVWVCGGFGPSTRRALRAARRGAAEGLWDDGVWHPCRPEPCGAPTVTDVGRRLLERLAARAPAGRAPRLRLPRGAGGRRPAALRRGRAPAPGEENPGQRARRERHFRELDRKRAAARADGQARKRRAGARHYVRHEGDLPAAAAAAAAPAESGSVASPCRHFFSAKGCSAGARCRFSHEEELLGDAAGPRVLLVHPRCSGLDAGALRLLLRGSFSSVLYLSSGVDCLLRDLQRLGPLAVAEEVLVLDPLPLTDHVEVLARLSLAPAATAPAEPLEVLPTPGRAAGASLARAETQGGRPPRPEDWLCGNCGNLVFRRHAERCPRCGSEKQARSEELLRTKSALAAVVKGGQRDCQQLRDEWLTRCAVAAGEGRLPSRDPMRHSLEDPLTCEASCAGRRAPKAAASWTRAAACGPTPRSSPRTAWWRGWPARQASAEARARNWRRWPRTPPARGAWWWSARSRSGPQGSRGACWTGCGAGQGAGSGPPRTLAAAPALASGWSSGTPPAAWAASARASFSPASPSCTRTLSAAWSA